MARSAAVAELIAWGVGHTPQIRWANCQVSAGLMPSMKISKPRNSVHVFQASTTFPFSTSQVMRR